MLDVKQGFDSLVKIDRKLKVSNPVTVVKMGASCKLDSNGEIVLTGADASLEDFVFFAFSTANIPDELNSAFKSTGKVTVLAPTVFREWVTYSGSVRRPGYRQVSWCTNEWSIEIYFSGEGCDCVIAE